MPGPPPKPTALRIVEGNPSRRPLPVNEPKYASCVPDRPKGLTPAARKIWDDLVREMAASGVLRRVDAGALAQLCEDQATLAALRKGLKDMLAYMVKKARRKTAMPGGPLIQLTQTIEGRRTLATIRELSMRIIIQRREFGLTPASNTRVQAQYGSGEMDPLEKALCG